jgi:acetyl esterase/lipase
MLDRDQLKKNGIEYAGDLSTKDPLCSPYYGDSSDVGEMALFMGTQDILYMDALRFKKKAERENYDLTFYEYKDMQHDWVLFPMDDAKEAQKEIVEFIQK